MNHMLLVCSDGIGTEEKAATMERELGAYVEGLADKHVYGHRLAAGSAAKTVRVRDGQTLVSDGPFAESKEFVAGFDLLECDEADAAAIAAAHPVSWFHSVEVRPLVLEHGDARGPLPEALVAGPPEDRRRFALFVCVDGVALDDPAEEDAVGEACMAWGQRVRDEGVCPFGVPLQLADTARTVRVRGGETLISDGPFVEAKEFLAGLIVLDVPTIDDAVALAAEHPLAAYHRLEVRPFHVD